MSSKTADSQETPKSKVSSTRPEKKSPGFLTKIFFRGSRESGEKTLDQGKEILDPETRSVNPGVPRPPRIAPPAQFVRPMHPLTQHTTLEPREWSQEGFPKDMATLWDADTETQKLRKSDSTSTLPVFKKVRHRMEAQRKLEGTDDDEGTGISHDEEDLDLGWKYLSETFGANNGSEQHMHLAPPQHGEMSKARSDISYAAVEDSELKSWELWLVDYTKGLFNLSQPPAPAPSAWPSGFEYLPAVLTSNEEERISLSQRYDAVWTPGAHTNKLVELVSTAAKTFKMDAACLSFFDEVEELVRIEGLLGRSRVERAESIAAHALFSREVMVVLDTHKDWRFKSNPLVLQEPYISFFAAAPLLSREGVVIGVLSLLDRRPRAVFAQKWRSELAEVGENIVAELDYVAETLTEAALRTTPLLDRDSLVRGTYQYKPRYSISYGRQFSTSKIEPELMPASLQYRPKPSINTNANFSYAGEPTPPPSAESNNNSWFDKPQSYGKNYEQLCEDPILPEYQALGQQANFGYRGSSPRPYSGSDLTSLRPPPFNSPDVSFEGADSSRLANPSAPEWNFYRLSDTDCAEEMATTSPAECVKDMATTSLATSAEEVASSNSVDCTEDMITSSTARISLGAQSTEVFPPFQSEQPERTSTNEPNVVATTDTVNTLLGAQVTIELSSWQPEPRKPNSQVVVKRGVVTISGPAIYSRGAQTSLDKSKSEEERGHLFSKFVKDNVRELCYQCMFHSIYCLEVQVNPSLPNDVSMHYISSFGEWPVNMDDGLIHEVMQSGGIIHWKDLRGSYKDNEYAGGYLVSLHHEQHQEQRLVGLVWGMFRKPTGLRGPVPYGSQEEAQLVVEFARKLTNHLGPRPSRYAQKYEREEDKPSHNTTEPLATAEKSSTEPTGSQAFPANEATELILNDDATGSPGVSDLSRNPARVEDSQDDSSAGQEFNNPPGQADSSGSSENKNSASVVSDKIKAATSGVLSSLGKGGLA